MEVDIDALQVLREPEPARGLYPCTWNTCDGLTCEWSSWFDHAATD
jgi:hypothetical protein